MKLIAHLYTGKTLIATIEDKGRKFTKTIDASHPNWKTVEKLYKLQEYDKMLELFDIAAAITQKSGGKFTIRNGQVFWGEEQVHGYLV